jgi:hypothetical protein
MKIPVPKPLLIVIVIIVILGVVSCGAGVFRGLNEDTEPAPGNAADEAGIDELEPGPVPAKDVRVTGPNTCSKSDDDDDGVFDITISTFCDVTIEGQVLLPRRLSLAVVSNPFPGATAVQQEIDGRLQPEPPESKAPEGGVVEISASGVGPVKVRILCGSCVLRIIG